MSLPTGFLAGADAELLEIFNRFEDVREGFGVEFLTVVDAYLARLAVFRRIAPVYPESVRRQVMQRFPSGIFYEVHPKRILIVAILDLGQDEQQILQRLRR